MTNPPIVVIIPRTTPAPARRLQAAPERHDFTPKGRPNPLAVAQFWLGDRLAERNGAHFLDGTYADLTRIMRETNRVLAENGREQIVVNPNWAA